MRQLLEKGCSIFMKDRILHLNEKNGRVLTLVEMIKNSLFYAKIELEGLREKSSSLVEFCNLLDIPNFVIFYT